MHEGIGGNFGYSPGLYSPRPYESEGAHGINYVMVVWAFPFSRGGVHSIFVNFVCGSTSEDARHPDNIQQVYLYWPSLHLSKLVA